MITLTTECGHAFKVSEQNRPLWEEEIRYLSEQKPEHGATFDCAVCGTLCILVPVEDERLVFGLNFNKFMHEATGGFWPSTEKEQERSTLDSLETSWQLPDAYTRIMLEEVLYFLETNNWRVAIAPRAFVRAMVAAEDDRILHLLLLAMKAYHFVDGTRRKLELYAADEWPMCESYSGAEDCSRYAFPGRTVCSWHMANDAA